MIIHKCNNCETVIAKSYYNERSGLCETCHKKWYREWEKLRNEINDDYDDKFLKLRKKWKSNQSKL